MSNYAKGARLERKTRKEYEKRGFVMYRSAGSKGAADLIGFHPKDKTVVLVQCKAHAVSLQKFTELHEELYQSIGGRAGQSYSLFCEVIFKR